MEFDITINGVRLAVEIECNTFDPNYIEEMRVYAWDSREELTGILSQDMLNDIEMQVREKLERVA